MQKRTLCSLTPDEETKRKQTYQTYSPLPLALLFLILPEALSKASLFFSLFFPLFVVTSFFSSSPFYPLRWFPPVPAFSSPRAPFPPPPQFALASRSWSASEPVISGNPIASETPSHFRVCFPPTSSCRGPAPSRITAAQVSSAYLSFSRICLLRRRVISLALSCDRVS